MSELAIHSGSCHCRAVRFEVDTPRRITVQRCNCSICDMTAFLHLIVPAARFRLLDGAECLTEYCFNTQTARHLFCRRCGIKSFYVPRSNPDGYSVNLRCLDRSGFESIALEEFDGRHWEDHGAELAHLSQEPRSEP